MPLYEYQCTKCCAEFEQMRSVHRAMEPTTCPQCGGVAERLFSSFATNVPYTNMHFSGPRRIHRKPAKASEGPAK